MFVPQIVDTVLRNTRTIAIVGASDNPARASRGIGRYLIAHDYDVAPVNPRRAEVYGRISAPSIEGLERKPDLVLCFRRCEEMPAIARSAVRCGAMALWMQTGIVNEEAADLALAAGLLVVMDRCIRVDHEAWASAFAG